jgi:hypothetical protein
MDKKDLLRPILWATIEDFVGLWEILWEVDNIFANKEIDSNKSTVKTILKCFFEQELINFYSAVWGESDDFIELGRDEVLEMLDHENYWQAPAINDFYIAVSATEKG